MYILSSAMRRSDALVSIRALRGMFEDHLVKIAVYGNDLNCLDHWIREVSAVLAKCGSYKTKSGKLSKDDYYDCLFAFEDFDMDDARMLVMELNLDNELYSEYPMVESTDETVKRVYKLFEQCMEYFPYYLSKVKTPSRPHIQSKLREFLEKAEK